LRFVVDDQTPLNVSRCCVAENKMFISKVHSKNTLTGAKFHSKNTLTGAKVMLLNTILIAGKSHVLNSVS
jgi:hypothetical protein